MARLDAREAWKRWEDLTCHPTPDIDLGVPELITHYDELGAPEKKASTQPNYASQFSVFTSRMATFLPVGRNWWVGPWDLIRPITFSAAWQAFWDLNLAGAAGVDFGSGAMAERSLYLLLPFATLFFNLVLRRGLWPALWSVNKIIVLAKRVLKVSTVSDTRGVHVLCFFSRWFFKIFVRRVQFWEGVYLFQGGFVKGARTVDHVFLLYVLFCQARYLRRPLSVVFVDVTSCFPSIINTLMILTWLAFGIGGTCCRLLWVSMVAGLAVLILKGVFRCILPNAGGVPQGSAHGPLSHNVFANDGPAARTVGREGSHGIPSVGGIKVVAADFADDRILPAFTHEESQNSVKRAACHYKRNLWSANVKRQSSLFLTLQVQYHTKMAALITFVMTLLDHFPLLLMEICGLVQVSRREFQ